MASNRWTRDELLVAFNLYCRTRFGSIHSKNEDIKIASKTLGRSPDALAMKMLNFTSFDPAQTERNVTSLTHTSKADRDLWEEFNQNSEALAFESEQAALRLGTLGTEPAQEEDFFKTQEGPTEATRSTRVRLVQRFFRDSVLAIYQTQCAICSLGLKELLVASHIIPWSHNVEQRGNPANGLALCALHDRAFDRGLLTIDESSKVLLSKRAQEKSQNRIHIVLLHEFSGARLNSPVRFSPLPHALEYHRKNIFLG